MSAIRQIIHPVSQRSSYSPSSGVDTLEFHLPSEGLVSGMRLSGEFYLSVNPTAGQVCLPRNLGAQAIVDQVQIMSVSTGETLELCRHYARTLLTRLSIGNAISDLAGTSKGCRELIFGSADASKSALINAVEATPVQFSLDLHCGLLEAGTLPLSRWGGLKIQVTLASDQRALARDSAYLGVYAVKNVNLNAYMQQEAPGDAKSPVEFIHHYTMPRTLNTGRAMFSLTVPDPVVGVFTSYVLAGNDVSPAEISLTSEQPPDVVSCSFMRGGQNFPLDKPLYADAGGTFGGIISKRFFDSVTPSADRIADGDTPMAGAASESLSGVNIVQIYPSAMGTGIRYASPQDFSSTPFGFELVSGVNSANPYVAYFTFKTIKAA